MRNVDMTPAHGGTGPGADDRRIKHVVILGGGTAGWMTASYLGKALQGNVTLTLLEAPTIPKIGVGEATVPNLQRVFFDYLGLREEQWMPECNAAFKMAVKYINWTTPGSPQRTARLHNGRGDYFYHPFGTLPNCDDIPLSHFWNYKRAIGETDEPFAHACFKEAAIMDHNLAPVAQRWIAGDLLRVAFRCPSGGRLSAALRDAATGRTARSGRARPRLVRSRPPAASPRSGPKAGG